MNNNWNQKLLPTSNQGFLLFIYKRPPLLNYHRILSPILCLKFYLESLTQISLVWLMGFSYLFVKLAFEFVCHQMLFQFQVINNPILFHQRVFKFRAKVPIFFFFFAKIMCLIIKCRNCNVHGDVEMEVMIFSPGDRR